MMPNRKNLPGFANPMRRPLPPAVINQVGRTAVAFPNKLVRPFPFLNQKKMKIAFV